MHAMANASLSVAGIKKPLGAASFWPPREARSEDDGRQGVVGVRAG
jgi:hypothetical protein